MTDRRPIASRNASWARRAAAWMARRGVSPNQISIASIGAGSLAGAAFWAADGGQGLGGRLLLLLGAAFCQARLVCNLLDGMVAVEGGRGGADGPFWNEFPDRVADLMILGGLGLGLGQPGLGFAAAALAVMTAYVRELGRALGAPQDFAGPMAKPHRMAVVTGAAALAALWPFGAGAWLLQAALWVIAAGCVLTVLGRSARLVRRLRG